MLAGMYDERRGANVLPAATGGQSMQPVQPVRGGFMPRGPIRPPPAAPQAQARALSATAKHPQRSPGIPPTISGPLLREANPMECSRGRARSARQIKDGMEDMLFHMVAIMVVVEVHATFLCRQSVGYTRVHSYERPPSAGAAGVGGARRRGSLECALRILLTNC